MGVMGSWSQAGHVMSVEFSVFRIGAFPENFISRSRQRLVHSFDPGAATQVQGTFLAFLILYLGHILVNRDDLSTEAAQAKDIADIAVEVILGESVSSLLIEVVIVRGTVLFDPGGREDVGSFHFDFLF